MRNTGARAVAAIVSSDPHSVLPLLHGVYRIVYVAADTFHIVCCILRRTRVFGKKFRRAQNGGVLHMTDGSAMFESVAISNPLASVRVT